MITKNSLKGALYSIPLMSFNIIWDVNFKEVYKYEN